MLSVDAFRITWARNTIYSNIFFVREWYRFLGGYFLNSASSRSKNVEIVAWLITGCHQEILISNVCTHLLLVPVLTWYIMKNIELQDLNCSEDNKLFRSNSVVSDVEGFFFCLRRQYEYVVRSTDVGLASDVCLWLNY